MNTATNLIFPAETVPTVPVVGDSRCYAVHRIFCVGRNYADHAKEMGFEVDREAPWYFTKPANALVLSGATVTYPPETKNYHYEMELVVAIGAPAFRIAKEAALSAVFGFAAGLDMTRRDLQIASREKSRPWDLGKAFEQSAIIAAIAPTAQLTPVGRRRISLTVNDVVKQDAKLSDLIWSVEEVVSHLSRFYHLKPGDLIYTGTPAGVGPVVAGDEINGEIEGLAPVKLRIAPAD